MSGQRGFSLIEVLVAVLVAAVIIAIVVPTITNASDRRRTVNLHFK
jgi:prepilin-type N-terminal cleavage/methylation domain-containing protein